MPLLHIVILALIQGITEFLPVSSSGHLVLAQSVMNGHEPVAWKDHMMLDVAVHVGTLFSVLLYFRHDVIAMVKSLKSAIKGQWNTQGSRLLFYVAIGSIPVVIAGAAMKTIEPGWLLSVEIIGWTTLLFGILLWIADKYYPNTQTLENLTAKNALIIGFFQVLALIPGVSRSGITMTAARFLGFNRTESAHYALLLGIVAISGAGILGGLSVIEYNTLQLTSSILLAVALSFVAGWVSIALMMKWLAHASFTIFAIYRVILGVALLALVYTGTL